MGLPLTTTLPEPWANRTRATAVLRRPVPANSEVLVSAIEISGVADRLARNLQRSRLLCGVRMFGSFINLQLRHQHATEAIFRDHAANSVSDELFGVLCPHLCDRPEPLATLPSRIAHELLVSLFFAGESHFFVIYDY